MTLPLLMVNAIDASYGPIRALRAASLEVSAGEIVALIGANGAGKTTLLMCCSGIVRVQEGGIFFDGKDITVMPAHAIVRAGLAQVPEGRRIFAQLSVAENLQLGAFIRPHDRSGIRQDLERIFTLFPILAERRSQLGGTLSGGEQQMLAIARALMLRPRLLLMDEPSMGVAPLLVERIFTAIRQLHREGLSILLVEQNAHLALATASRAYVLESGTVALAGPSAIIAQDPRIRAAYLGESL